MKIKQVVLCALVSFALSACATEPEMKKAEETKVLDAKGLQALFKFGGGGCKWTAGDVSGEDFYYATASKAGGDADRNVGSNTLQGTWALKGDQLCVNFGKEECSTLEDLGKKKYKATFSGKAYDLGC